MSHIPALVLAILILAAPMLSAQVLQAPETGSTGGEERLQGGSATIQAVPARPTIPGGPSRLTILQGAEEADFCCTSGSGGQGTDCTEFDPDDFICQDFTLHCDGSWSCQPGGSSCECL